VILLARYVQVKVKQTAVVVLLVTFLAKQPAHQDVLVENILIVLLRVANHVDFHAAFAKVTLNVLPVILAHSLLMEFASLLVHKEHLQIPYLRHVINVQMLVFHAQEPLIQFVNHAV
jgi:hypothetical protein